jgi:hypothetical protein
MHNDTENKKSRAGPFGMTGWHGFLFAKMWGLPSCKYGLLDTEMG